MSAPPASMQVSSYHAAAGKNSCPTCCAAAFDCVAGTCPRDLNNTLMQIVLGTHDGMDPRSAFRQLSRWS